MDINNASAPTSTPQSGVPRVTMVQDGGRLHYAVPVALLQAGMLNRVFAEWFVTPGSLEQAIGNAVRLFRPVYGKKMLDRSCSLLPPSMVRHNPWILLRRHFSAVARASFPGSVQELARLQTQWIVREKFAGGNMLMGFTRAIDPDLCAGAQRAGLVTVMDQIIAPVAVELEEIMRQTERWPGWEGEDPISSRLRPFLAWEQKTWAHTDHFTCGSDYVRDGMVAQGIDAGRITVLPYPLDVTRIPVVDRGGRPAPLKVGFVGQVGLRKGTPYFFEVARQFDPRQVQFTMVGPIQLNPAIAAKHRGNVELIGSVPRSEVRAWLERFDVFLFPSTCEGSAGAVMEAAASGLPIIATHNSGSVIRDGIEGFIVPYDNIQRQVECVRQLKEDEGLRLRMGRAARQRVEGYDLQWYGRELAAILTQVLGSKRKD